MSQHPQHTNAVETVHAILRAAARAESLEEDWQASRLTRYRTAVDSYLLRSTYQAAHWQRVASSVALFAYPLAAPLVSGALEGGNKGVLSAMVWLAYAIVGCCIAFIQVTTPSSEPEFRQRMERIRFTHLATRLAAEVALLDLTARHHMADDDMSVVRFTQLVPPYKDFEPKARAIIEKCLATKEPFSSSRETNLMVPPIHYPPGAHERLNDLCAQLTRLSSHFFGGHNYTAKIYLRAAIDVDADVPAEVLVSVAKYPQGEATFIKSGKHAPTGSSWVHARGNPSIVWRCLESGTTENVARLNDAYYESVLALCLPGRIGVLAITSDVPNGFAMADAWVERSLVTATDHVVRSTLGLDA